MKHLICALVGAVATGLLAAGASCIVEDNSTDEKHVATKSAEGFDLLGMSSSAMGAAMDVRSCTCARSAALSVETGAVGFCIIIR